MTQRITPRDYRFYFSAMPKAWLNNNSYLTHMFNAPSICLPYVEGLVSSSVKFALDKIKDPQLLNDCQNFVEQESLHAREHIEYNKQLHQLGYEADAIVARLKKKLSHIKKKWSLLSVLAVVASFECLTAAVSRTVLEDNTLQDGDAAIAKFWRWHMMDELEHKAVLFDLYQHLGGGYFRRIGMHAVVMSLYCYYALKIYVRLIRKDQGSAGKGLLFASSRRSFFRKSLLRTFAYYFPKYHPNSTPTNHLIQHDNVIAHN